MTNASTHFLIDTNVLLYSYDSRNAVKRERAIEVLDALAVSGAGALSFQVIGEFYSNATRKLAIPLTREQARDSVTRLCQSWRVLEISLPIVLDAIRGATEYMMSYWDALIWATARFYRVANVLTEDRQGRPIIEGVRILNPFTPDFDFDQLS